MRMFPGRIDVIASRAPLPAAARTRTVHRPPAPVNRGFGIAGVLQSAVCAAARLSTRNRRLPRLTAPDAASRERRSQSAGSPCPASIGKISRPAKSTNTGRGWSPARRSSRSPPSSIRSPCISTRRPRSATHARRARGLRLAQLLYPDADDHRRLPRRGRASWARPASRRCDGWRRCGPASGSRRAPPCSRRAPRAAGRTWASSSSGSSWSTPPARR